MTQPRLRPMGFGEILDGGFNVYRRHFGALFLTALIPFVPMTLAVGYGVSGMADPATAADPSSAMLMLPMIVVYAVGFLLVWAAITRQTAQAVVGAPVTVADGFAHGLRRLMPLLVAAMIVQMLATLAITGAAIAGAGAAMAIGVPGRTAGVAVALVVAVVVGFGLLLALAGAFAIAPAAVVEGRGPLAAIARSWRLARGARLRILGVLLVSWLITTLPALGVMGLAGMGGAVAGAGASPTMATVLLVANQLVTALGAAFTTPLWVACVTLLYYDRRARTEGYDLELEVADLAGSV